MAEVEANGVRFHVERIARAGAHPPIVFVHGLLVDDLSSLYFPLARPLAGAGADAVLYDLRGHGYSERPASGYALSDSVTDLAALLAAVGLAGPVHLVGNSYGGTVAMAFAAAHPDRVASLVLIDAHFPDPRWAEQMLTAVRGLARDGNRRSRMSARVDALLTATTLRDDLRATPPFALPALNCPVRAIYGERSVVLDHARRLERSLPHVELTVVPGCSHWILTEAPETVRTATLEWFSPWTRPAAGRVRAAATGPR